MIFKKEEINKKYCVNPSDHVWFEWRDAEWELVGNGAFYQTRYCSICNRAQMEKVMTNEKK